ncbi:hypothetical protein lbkm_3829 [Lachnospiraceae bacterium KM106-2]|nr:hypothetical protein lbkm_3829 [Lachnospiraceae bacterium KM106-2]
MDSITKVENEKKKEFLLRYRIATRKIESLEEQRESLIRTMRSAKAVRYSDMPHGNKQSDLSDYIVKLDEMINAITNTLAVKIQLQLEIEGNIVNMEDGLECDILRKHYIELKSFEEIAEELQYTYRHIIRMHSSALEHFKINGSC